MDKSTSNEKPLSPKVYFEPDVLSGHQYFKIFRQKSLSEKEEKLMFAVLSDAIECFQRYADAKTGRSRTLFREAEAWITSRDLAWPYSFENICDVLNLSADYIRVGLLRWRCNHQADRKVAKRLREPLRYRYRVKHTRVGL